MIEGSFKDVSLPALLQLLCFETAKSFRIAVNGESQKGFIAVRQGWVIAAQFGLLEGEDAICEFQSWSDGSFHAQQVAAQLDSERNLRFDFQPNYGFINDCSILNEHHIGLNSELTGSRIFGSSEWKALVQEHPLDRECFSVLAWLREGRKMRQALREFGFDIVRATAILAMLIRTHSVEVIRPGLATSDERREPVSDKIVPTTGGQQEAAAALAREAARALESATDVADEAFMSTSFKSPEFTESKANHRAITLDPQTSSYSLDTQSRSSMEARLRAKKNSGVHSASDLQSFGKITGPNQALPNPMLPNAPPAPTGASDASAQTKKPKPDLFSVLQSRAGKVVPDLGTSTPQGNSGQVTASTHNLPTLKQARLKTDKPELLKPVYAQPSPEESPNFSSIRKELASSSEEGFEESIISSSYAWKGPAEPSPLSVNWPKNIPSNTFQNMPAQRRTETRAEISAPQLSSAYLDDNLSASTPMPTPAPLSSSSPTPISEQALAAAPRMQAENSNVSGTANPALNQMLTAETEKSKLSRVKTSAEGPGNSALITPQATSSKLPHSPTSVTSGQSIPIVQGVHQPQSPTQAAANLQSAQISQPTGNLDPSASAPPVSAPEPQPAPQPVVAPENPQPHLNARYVEQERVSTDLISDNDPRVVAKTDAMPVVAFDIERLLLTTFLATQFGKLALGNPSLDLHRRQTLMDAEYGKCLAVSIEDQTRLPSAVLASYRYCLERGYIETHDPVIPLTADLLLGRMEIDQYLLQRRRITGDELRDLIKVAREEGIKLTQLLVKSGYLTEADLETLGREQKRFAFK